MLKFNVFLLFSQAVTLQVQTFNTHTRQVSTKLNLINENSVSVKGRRAFITTMISGSALLRTSNSEAACLTGDSSEQCIGVYKVPIDDGIIPYIETPEKLKTYAPDLKWIPPVPYPKNFAAAMKEIKGIGKDIIGVQNEVSSGSLTSAGVELLKVIPRFTVCGRVILQNLEQREDIQNFYPLIEDRYNNLYVEMHSCDVTIGQGLRGELGVSAVAQINILSELKQIEVDHYYFVRQIGSLS